MKQKLIILISILWISSCSLSISNLSNNLNAAIKSSDDPQTLIQALPSYIILLDAMIESDPQDENILLASSKMINTYASLLAEDIKLLSIEEEIHNQNQFLIKKNQLKKLSEKSLNRATLANCYYKSKFCGLTKINYSEFKIRLQNIDEDDLDMLYSLGAAWANWLQINSDDWNARAKIPQIKHIMEKIVLIDEHWENAGAYLYLGVLNSLLPKSLGGKPDIGKYNFEKAIELTQGKNLMAKVLFAEYYARLTFNKKLHNKLVSEVLSCKITELEFKLINTIAIHKAKILQASSEDYF